MSLDDKKSGLDRLKKGLYSRNGAQEGGVRHDIHGLRSDVSESWEDPKANEAEEKEVKTTMKTTRRVYSYLFLSALGFFLIAAIAAGFTLFGGKNFISVDNVDILVEGPASIPGGDVLALNVSVVNKNGTDIELVDLIAEYPEGTKDAADSAQDLSKVRVSLGDIKSNSFAQKELDSLMFGEEGEVKEIKFTAEYRTKDSNAIFYKEKAYKATISSSPVIVSIDALDKALGGEPQDMTVTVVSNTNAPLKNLLLSLEYPFGFTVISSSPEPSYPPTTWRIGDLAPGAKRTIKLRVSLEGQDAENKVLHAHVGIASKVDEKDMATTIISRDHTFSIERPFLGLDLTLDGSRSDLAAQPGRTVRGSVLWANNSGNKITNARIEVKLSGNVLDKNSVTVENGGYYNSVTNTIIWESGRAEGFESIAPGESGRVDFGFTTYASIPGESAANPLVTISVSGKGSRIDDAGAPQDIISGVTRTVRLVSNLALTSRALRSQGPFQNSGPVPPFVDATTTYTVVWTVTNTSNSITGAKVEAALPPYVTWLGAVSPSDANITYNPTGGGIVWVAGNVPRNASVGSGAKQVAFQIALRPAANQVGEVPELVSRAIISGTDVFTGANLENSAPAVTTRTSTDLLFKSGDEVVRQ